LTTRNLHADRAGQPEHGVLHKPVHPSVAFGYADARELAEVFQGKRAGYAYGRQANPTVAALQHRVTMMEDGMASIAFSTGMAAIATIALTLLKAGDHMISSAFLFGNTNSFFRTLARFGIEVDFVDATNAAAVAEKIRPQTRIVFAETIANPVTQIADLEGIGALCRERGLLYVVDNTMTTPHLYRPKSAGAGLVVKSLTKYIGGHGNALGGAVTGFQYYRAAREGRRRPSKLRDHSMHAPGYRICIESGFLGSNLVFSTACTSSNLALAAALDLVRTNKADVVVAGGFEPLSLISCAGFSVMRNVTPGICRPFDRHRDGLVLGEGSAVLIVEADDFAARRGARALAAVRGYGLVSDARSMTAPDPTAAGPSASMRHAMDMAGLTPDRVDWVCAHGTGTLLNDRAEARALRQVFGRRSAEVPCTSIKSMIGHTLGAAGAMNAVAALAAGRGDYIPPTVHFEEPDPRDPVACSSIARSGAPKHVLSNTLGFGGSNCSVVIELAGDSGVRE